MKGASDLDVSSHAFDHKSFWDKIKTDEEVKIVKFSGKKKDLLKPEWERGIYIIYKSVDGKVACMDDITPEKITIFGAVMSNYGCDGARNLFNCLGTFILKTIKLGVPTISTNIGFGFMIATLLKRKGVQLVKELKSTPMLTSFGMLLKALEREEERRKQQ